MLIDNDIHEGSRMNKLTISNINVSTHCIPLKRPYKVANQYFEIVDMIQVHIETKEGVTGFGTGTLANFLTGEVLSESLKALNEFNLEPILGRSLESPEKAIELIESAFINTPAALAAIDIALYDAFAKSEKKSLLDYLGQHHTALPTSVTIGIKDSLEDALIELKEYVDAGFKAIKIKVGGTDLQSDITLLQEVKRRIPRDTHLYVDPNQGYSFEECIKFIQKTHDLGIAFLEQPVSVDDAPLLASLNDKLKEFICLDESLMHHQTAAEWEQYDSFPGHIFNIKLMKCGGITNASKIARIAKRNQIKLMFGCMDESCASISAALNFAYSQPHTRFIDLDGSFDLQEDLFKGGFELKNGLMYPIKKPGLGVTPFKIETVKTTKKQPEPA